MSRSTKKGQAIDAKLLKKVEALNRSGQKAVIKTWSRSSTILPEMVVLTIGVHDGRRGMFYKHGAHRNLLNPRQRIEGKNACIGLFRMSW